jgi:hypothetical protein
VHLATDCTAKFTNGGMQFDICQWGLPDPIHANALNLRYSTSEIVGQQNAHHACITHLWPIVKVQ